MIIFIIIQQKLDFRLSGFKIKHKSDYFKQPFKVQHWKMLVGLHQLNEARFNTGSRFK